MEEYWLTPMNQIIKESKIKETTVEAEVDRLSIWEGQRFIVIADCLITNLDKNSHNNKENNMQIIIIS